ncbi:Helicase required for RNAi-mediated heterochromatin assembly 1 [Geodia barretti]|uniref:Helicase required for RNAi-mediated heterochromatin assembly 1 n=1 Tax=Geodia barretti TaxID=519541 RepID=A0AA35TQU0_GEOBA|nr:Helicase required for RNAi-mediated heterochromatin assembly 1 [Geodia barretti]
MGIVIDLYPREGYIVLASGKGCHRRTQQVFKLGPATTTEVVSSIHLGDIVQFLVSSSAPEAVERVVKIKQYCSEALDVTFASDYLTQNKGLVNLFENEAAMKAILNASHVYTSPDVCAKLISTACSALSDLASSIKKKMLALLKSSSFILDVVQIAPEEVTKSMKVLEKYLEHFPNEVCVLVPALESMVDVLQKQDKPLELAAFVSFLSSSTCLLPHSVEIARQPWQTVPTLLTEEEWKAGAVANTDYLPCVKDCYTSVHEYGRTYFLLLRADCYGDLATSIRRLRDPTASNNKATDEAVVVYDATITAFSNYSAGHKLVYHFTIKTQPQSSENVSSDAPFLKAGNLLCLSVGGRFKDDIIWATINHVSRYIHFGENETKQCEVLVELCTESNTLSDEEAMLSLNNSGNVVALESPAYFRAYQPVLDALKQMDMEKIHFLPDLLNPGKEPQASLELINDNTLVTDLGGLKQEADGVPVVMTVGELREQLSDTEQYTDFCLPKFQRIAVERALSQALSLIQGPPGTGKSYIGMQLLRLFLSMKNSSGKLILENKPALVIAYKNRALDLFIKMCTSFCSLDRIVRIGHLSKDNEEELRCTLLNEKVMSGLDRNRTVELKAAMEHQYERVQMARIALVATVEMAGLNECLDHITPEWLQSLILDQGSVSAAYGVAARVRDDPERCLDLLQRARMGERDRQERQEIEETLSRAWSKWVEGIRWDPQDPVPGTSGSLQYDSDSELDSREYEEYYDTLQKRNNAVETLTSVYADFEDGPVEVSNVWALSPDDRRRMIRAATRERYESAMDDLKDSIRQYNMIRELYEKRREEKAVEILKGAKVVAMTTTGAAINQRLLNQLEAPVVFVEEAAEILESNLLAVLTPHVKHMVLIGDQKQLKPTVVWNKLASDRYKFDVSLFERLIRNKYPHTLLLRQSRMHPSLVPLYGYHYQRGPITIRSADKTKDLVHPKCMGKNFFWWSYSGAYETRREKGYMNTHEIDMVVSLCCWLLCNRVESGKIAVLTPYRGQVHSCLVYYFRWPCFVNFAA